MPQNAPLHITLLNDSFPPTIDGVANVTVNYARILAEGGDDVCVATPAYPDVTDDYPFAVYRYPSLGLTEGMGYRAGVPFSPELLHTLEARQPDVIHTHCPVMSTLLARMLRPRVQAPVIFTYHTKFDIDIQKAVHGKLLQEASIRALVNNISACDEVWVVSEGAGQNLRSLGYAGEYRVMENGVDFPRGEAAPCEVEAARARWGIPQRKPVFLFVGRMMWYKGLRLSLDALRAAAAAGEDFCFVLVGDGVDRAEIEAYAAECGLTDRCVFTGAIRDREALRAVFGCADLFLFPSTFDTNGIVVREAAACSCASLLVAGSCAAEGVTDGQTGFLFDGTVEEMTRCIRRVCADRALAHRVGRQAAEGIYISWQDAVARARARYVQVAEDWRAGRLRRAQAPGDDFYETAGAMLAGLGRAENRLQQAQGEAREDWEAARETARSSLQQARENREAAQHRKELEHMQAFVEREKAMRGGYDRYMSYLKNHLTDRLDETRADGEALLKSLHDLWQAQLEKNEKQ